MDLTAPTNVVISPTGGSDGVNAAEKAASVLVSGTTDAGNTIFVSWGGVEKSVTSTDGSWSVNYAAGEVPVDAATSTISVTARDAAGNISSQVTQNVTIDTALPATPVISTVAGDDLINATERAGNIIVSGTAEPNATLVITWNGFSKPVTASGTGDWAVTYASTELPSDGTSIITARATDAAGNANAVDGTRSVTTQTSAAPLPVINDVAGDDTINIAERAAGVTVTGTASALAQVAVTFGTTTRTVTASETGAWTANFAPSEIAAEGPARPITAVQTDVNGNVSGTATRNVEVDLTAPTTPAISIVAGDDKINAAEAMSAITISGTAAANATLKLNWDSTPERTVTADASGNWSEIYVSNALPTDGIRAITATQTDAAGNISGQASRSVEIDTVLPPTPVITGMSNDYGVYGDFRTDRNAVVLTGTGPANGQIELRINGESRGFATVDSAGLWVSPVIDLSELNFNGSVTATVRAIAAAGNVSATDASQVITKGYIGETPIDLGLLTSSKGFSVAGPLSEDYIGGITTGDINDDGRKDLILNSSGMDFQGLNNAGGVTVVFGRENWNTFGIFDLGNLGNNGWVLRSTITADQLGFGGSGTADLDGDGNWELIAGAARAENGSLVDAGVAYIVWGSNGPLGTLVTTGANQRYILATTEVTPSLGLVFRGLTAAENLGNGTLGISSRPGANSDFNGDGLGDFFIAVRGYDRPTVSGLQTAATDVGATIVVFGRADRTYGTLNASGQQEMTINDLTADKGFIIRGGAALDAAGYSIASAGDVNGDGVSDLLIGARLVDRPSFGNAGAAYVIYGKRTPPGQGGGQTWAGLINDPEMPGRKILDLGTLQTSDGFKISGENQNGQFGFSVEGLGDVNGDGFDDIVVGAPFATVNGAVNTGSAFVIFGSASGRQTLNIPNMTSAEGFIIRGDSALTGNTLEQQLGLSVGAAGDVNGDGLADIMVNAPYQNRGANIDVGRSYIILGKNNGEGWGQSVNGQSILDLSNFGVGDGFSLIGEDRASEQLGNSGPDSSLISPGDLNGDGFDDLFINAHNGDTPGRTNNGEGYFIYGSRASGGGLSLTGTNASDALSGGGLADTIDGQRGPDVLRGFAGNDILIIGDAGFVRVDGGTGTDTLRLAGPSGFGLDLSTLAAGAIKDIEQIDLVAGSLNNTLTITQQTLLDLSTTSNRLTVLGDSGDIVNASGFTAVATGQNLNGILYNTYTNGSAELWVQQGVVVELPSAQMMWAQQVVLAA